MAQVPIRSDNVISPLEPFADFGKSGAQATICSRKNHSPLPKKICHNLSTHAVWTHRCVQETVAFAEQTS